MLEIGINSITYCGSSTKEMMQNAKKTGFEYVMVTFRNGEGEKDLISAKELGLNVCCVHLDYKYSSDLWVKGITNEKYVDSIIEQIRLCEKFGVKIAVIHPTNGTPSCRALEPNEHGLNSMLKILDEAKKCGVQIALENLDAVNLKNFEYLMNNISSEKLKFCYDVGHHNLYYPEKDLLKKYGDRLICVHLHDNLMDWEFGYDHAGDIHLIPFDGKINYEKTCKELADVGFDGVVLLEVHRISKGAPNFYFETSDAEFLKKSYFAGEKIARKLYDNLNKTL